MPSEEERIEVTKRALYDRGQHQEPIHRSGLSPADEAGSSDWQHTEPLRPTRRWFSPRLLKRVLWGSAGFFVIMLALVIFVFYRGHNLVSAGNVAIAINGPIAVAAGQELDLQVAVTNHNGAALELVDLIVEYPPGTHTAGESGTTLTRERIPLGKITAGGQIDHIIKAVLFGEKDSSATINLTVEYRIAGSSAIFDKTSNYAVNISSTPLVLLLGAPKEVNSNQEILLTVSVQSNATSLISSPAVLVTYPAGFHFLKANPVPTRGDNIWQLDSLKPGDKRSLQIRGTLEGQDEEQKSFRVAAGLTENDTAINLSVTYGSALETVTIKRPFISLGVAINGSNDSEYISNSREPLRVDLSWLNNLSTEVMNGQVLVEFSGKGLDQSTVSADKGFYDSTHNTILWNKTGLPDLEHLATGANGQTSFSFATVSLAGDQGKDLRQPELDLKVKFQGQRAKEGGETEPIYIETVKKIKLNSDIQLAGKVLQRTGLFPNHGPVPPQVGVETSYTVVWSVLNSSNPLTAAKVMATLPSYVKWLGATQPTGETVTYQTDDSGGGAVLWDLGQVSPGTGSDTPAREVSFQVALTPSLSQVGEAPTLVTSPTFSGLDNFTKQVLTTTLKRIQNTELVSEAGFHLGEERVVKQL